MQVARLTTAPLRTEKGNLLVFPGRIGFDRERNSIGNIDKGGPDMFEKRDHEKGGGQTMCGSVLVHGR